LPFIEVLFVDSAQVPNAGGHIPIDIIDQTPAGLDPEVVPRNLLSPPLLHRLPALVHLGHTLARLSGTPWMFTFTFSSSGFSNILANSLTPFNL